MNPLVTVIIPTYNRAGTIRRSIESVLQQSYKELEVIVVDDCSSDNTVRQIESFSDTRIKVIRLSRNRGANFARNVGIGEARGEFIAFQDSDDEWLKDKLELQLKHMAETKKKVCFCPYTLYDENKKTIYPDNSENKERYEEQIVDVLRKKNVISTQTLVMHREVTDKVGLFDETMRRLQDYEFVIRLCQKYEIAYVNSPLVNVYRMENCISNNIKAFTDSYRKIFIKHYDFIDFKSFLFTYLFNCQWYDEGGIYWEYIDDIQSVTTDLEMSFDQELFTSAREKMLKWYNFFSRHIRNNEFVIYGAGFYGREVYKILKDAGCTARHFLVTRNHSMVSEIDGIPVMELDEIINWNLPVVIAVDETIQEELIRELKIREITEYTIYPFC